MKSPFSKNRLVFAAGLIASVLSISSSAFAQLNSGSSAVGLTATMAESLTLSTNINAVTFNLVQGGTTTGNAPVIITTTWLLQPSRANVEIDGYFSSPTAALTDGLTTPDYIPSSAVLGTVTTSSSTAIVPTGAAPFTATTSTGLGEAGAGLALAKVPLTVDNRAHTETTNLSLQINLSDPSLLQTPAGTYTGTLTLQAQAL